MEINSKINKWTILEEKRDKRNHKVYKCLCECGNIAFNYKNNLINGQTKSCKKCGTGKRIDINDYIGKRFGKYLVLEKGPMGPSHAARFYCKCDCGKKNLVYAQCLKNGKSKQCNDCRRKTTGTHRLSKSSTYKSWRGMFQRCYYPKSTNYYLYGGRGIKVCDRWNKFENFLQDMGIKPMGKRIALDRIDSDGDYEPNNCRWLSQDQNNNNRRLSKKNRNNYLIIKKELLCATCIKHIKPDNQNKD